MSHMSALGVENWPQHVPTLLSRELLRKFMPLLLRLFVILAVAKGLWQTLRKLGALQIWRQVICK